MPPPLLRPLTAPATESSSSGCRRHWRRQLHPAAPITSFSQLAANLNADTWECSVCETRNKPTLAKCAACDTPRPSTGKASDAAAEKKDTGAITSAGFSFPSSSFGGAASCGTDVR